MIQTKIGKYYGISPSLLFKGENSSGQELSLGNLSLDKTAHTLHPQALVHFHNMELCDVGILLNRECTEVFMIKKGISK